jgi:hypothetical protein
MLMVLERTGYLAQSRERPALLNFRFMDKE